MTPRIRTLTRLSLLTALSLLLFTAESALPAPVPVPGVKLGLANVVTVWALYRCSVAETALVLASRVALAALLAGRPASAVFSAAGALFCMAGAVPLRRIVPEKRLWLTSAVCGLLHNLGQLCAAVAVARAPALWSYLPFLLAAGLVSGSLTGALASLAARRVSLALARPGGGNARDADGDARRKPRSR